VVQLCECVGLSVSQEFHDMMAFFFQACWIFVCCELFVGVNEFEICDGSEELISRFDKSLFAEPSDGSLYLDEHRDVRRRVLWRDRILERIQCDVEGIGGCVEVFAAVATKSESMSKDYTKQEGENRNGDGERKWFHDWAAAVMWIAIFFLGGYAGHLLAAASTPAAYSARADKRCEKIWANIRATNDSDHPATGGDEP